MDYTVLYRTRADGYEEAIYFESSWVKEAVAKLYPDTEPEDAWATFMEEYTTEETDQLLAEAILAHAVAVRCCKDLGEIEEYHEDAQHWRSTAIADARVSIGKQSFA